METPLDDQCDLRIFGKSDQVFSLLAKHMNLQIPSFRWTINIWVGNTCERKGKKYAWTLHVTGDCGFQSNFLLKAEVKKVEQAPKKQQKLTDGVQWIPMEGEGEGMFEYSQESHEEVLFKIRIHFIPTINVQPQEIEYQLNFDTSKKGGSDVGEEMIGDQTYILHLKDIQYGQQ